jgi:hypothetical protein
MGEDFFPAHRTNPYGHWEDKEFLEANDQFVMKRSISEVQWRQKVEAIIARRVAMNRPWGWKDPRTSLLIPQYMELLPHARFLRCRRQTEAIVDSFLRAYGDHGWTEPLACRVIREREASLDQHLPAHRTLVIHFDELKRNREVWIRLIIDFCGLPAVSAEQMEAALDFIRPHG